MGDRRNRQKRQEVRSTTRVPRSAMFRRSPPRTKLTVRAHSGTKTNGFHASHSRLINETTKNGDVRVAAKGARDHTLYTDEILCSLSLDRRRYMRIKFE